MSCLQFPGRHFACLCAFMLLCCCAMPSTVADEPVKLIFDTDMGNDCDDVLALGVIHALQTRGHCELLAVTTTKDHPLCAAFVDCINTFYGRGDIPIGVVRNGMAKEEGRFLKLAAAKENGEFIYPHDLLSGDDAPEAVGLLRKTLAAHPDGSVVMVQVGFSTNLARLMESKADDVSPLDGMELIRKKISLLSIMAGGFELVKGKPFLEYNVAIDPPSATKIIAGWPTPIVFSGHEIGMMTPYPAWSILQDYHYVKHHPLAEAYILYNPPPHNRPCYDLTSVLYAVFPEREYFNLSPPGTVSVEGKGLTPFKADPAGKHRFMLMTKEQIIRTTETLVQLSSQPPAGIK